MGQSSMGLCWACTGGTGELLVLPALSYEKPAGCTALLQLTQQMAVHRRVSGCSCDFCLLPPPRMRDPQRGPSDPLSPCQCSEPTCKHLFNHQGLGRSTGSLWGLQLPEPSFITGTVFPSHKLKYLLPVRCHRGQTPLQVPQLPL